MGLPSNCIKCIPANTEHLYNICTTSAQRLRRWSNIVQMLHKCFVFAGMTSYITIDCRNNGKFVLIYFAAANTKRYIQHTYSVLAHNRRR